MLYPILALIIGLAVLVWSADKFIDGASGVATHFGMSPLLIGILIVGFGTSAPEMVVSAIAALQGSPGLALGNAYGSNVANITLILGATALFTPLAVHSGLIRKELPLLALATALAAYFVWNLELSRWDGILMLLAFAAIMAWSTLQGLKGGDPYTEEIEAEFSEKKPSFKASMLWLIVGLVLLSGSSQTMVWGATEIAQALGVSDLVIGLTIVAIGTSLPELASSLTAARKGEHDMVLGNVVGSNLFNTLAVVGIASVIKPFSTVSEILTRDLLVVGGLTAALFFICYGRGGRGRINRVEAVVLLAAFVGYQIWVFVSERPVV